MTTIIFTQHATEKLSERSITKTAVKNTLADPDSLSFSLQDGVFAAKQKQPNGKLLIVFFCQEADKIRVITVIQTSKLRKYLS